MSIIGEYYEDEIVPEYKKKIQHLEALILTFRLKIKADWLEAPYRYNEDFLKEFDEHFNITTERYGRTED